MSLRDFTLFVGGWTLSFAIVAIIMVLGVVTWLNGPWPLADCFCIAAVIAFIFSYVAWNS